MFFRTRRVDEARLLWAVTSLASFRAAIHEADSAPGIEWLRTNVR
jgi:hypothetical protein